MTGVAKNNPLVINVDNDSNNSGTLTVASTKLVDSNDSHVTITAWDLTGWTDSRTKTAAFMRHQLARRSALGASERTCM